MGLSVYSRNIDNITELEGLKQVQSGLQEFLEVNKRYPIIAITGPSGVGKSTFTELVSQSIGAKIFTELPELSPYLKLINIDDSLSNDQNLWYKNQSLFLSTDCSVLDTGSIFASQSPVVFDFSLVQVKVFADMNLSGNRLKSFNQQFNQIQNMTLSPDLIIRLSASDEVILERMEKRNTYIDEQLAKFMQILNGYYQSGIVEDHYEGVQIVELDTTELNLVSNEKHISDAVVKLTGLEIIKTFLNSMKS